jgi:2-iminobutanoate/2-iminopropanoate deaminase
MSDTNSKGREEIRTDRAPAAVGPYSQAVRVGDLVLCSGQIPLDPKSGAIVAGDFAEQARRVLDNLSAVVDAAGCSMADVVRTTIYLVDLSDFSALNEIYARYFEPPFPARSTVQVSSLPRGARIEIDAMAYAPGQGVKRPS